MSNTVTVDFKFKNKVTIENINNIIDILFTNSIQYYFLNEENNEISSQNKIATWVFHDTNANNPHDQEIINGDIKTCIENLSKTGGYIPMQSLDNTIYIELNYHLESEEVISFVITNESVWSNENSMRRIKEISQEILNILDCIEFSVHDEEGYDYLNYSCNK